MVYLVTLVHQSLLLASSVFLQLIFQIAQLVLMLVNHLKLLLLQLTRAHPHITHLFRVAFLCDALLVIKVVLRMHLVF